MIIYTHKNSVGTGSQLRIDITPATDEEQGTIDFMLIAQSCNGGFDVGENVQISLRVNKIGHLISVLTGDETSILGGKGVSDTDDFGVKSTLHIDAVEKPYRGHAIHITERYPNGSKKDGRIILNITESVALGLAITAAIDRIAFGK